MSPAGQASHGRQARAVGSLSFSVCLTTAVSALPVAPLREVLLSASAAPSLLQTRSTRQRSSVDRRPRKPLLALAQASQASGQRLEDPKPAGWFGDFSQQESTYDVGGLDAYMQDETARITANGVEVAEPVPLKQRMVQPAKWFHESVSAGAHGAWQAHYPPVNGEIAGNRDVVNNNWRSTPEGWVQDYVPTELTTVGDTSGPNPAEWFDSSVSQLDGFGRERVPDRGDPRRLQASLLPWEKRELNTTISCKTVGCTATASLAAFDAAKEEAKNCVLNIRVHPTDFDEDLSKESVENWIVNEHSVNGRCEPMARGCNATAARPLVSCLSQYPVDHLFNATSGELAIKGTLSKMVDECPYEGNLMSGVVHVSCFVRPIPPPPNVTEPGPVLAEARTPLTVGAPLRCKDPGCTAQALLTIDPDIAFAGGKCTLNVTINQTDFDDELEGAPERVEWLQLEGYGTGNNKIMNLSTDAKPGKNPCNSKYQGTVLTEQERSFSLVTGQDVTEQVTAPPSGQILITGKISEHVDECAVGGPPVDAPGLAGDGEAGYLLDGWITLHCEPAADNGTSGSTNGGGGGSSSKK
eukprot:TRINITY_DN82306_c0_g1_i1.p1 TRINITY_DN82306_c0_g1~~TRINITY_DN82306_c0_g1_i1.p1  ORF type:complete len:582 (-),score=113.52 TRINITY_DN82306_c0_g1_i1:54-1799(-)